MPGLGDEKLHEPMLVGGSSDQIGGVQLLMDRDSLASVVYALEISRLDCCNVLRMGLPLTTVLKL